MASRMICYPKEEKKKIRKFRVTGKTLSFQIDGKFAEMHSISQS